MGNECSQHDQHATAKRFDFSEDRHRAVYVCAHVLARAPILYVAHDAEGDWQFLCGQQHDNPDSVRMLCLEEVVAADPDLNKLAKLDKGLQATRQQIGAEWAVSDPSERFIQRCVAELGFCVQGIEGAGEIPGFAYTIGLQKTFDEPELLVFGLPLEAAQRLLNIVGERIREGQRFEPGSAYSGLVAAHDIRFREVLDPASLRAHVGYALWYYGQTPLRLFQLIWPDENGHFPDAPTAPAWLQKLQPLLP
jgi:Domain of unknown function (DUF4262)